MEDSRSSVSEKEPFLFPHHIKISHPQARNWKLVVSIWLAGHIALFGILGSVLVLTIKATILEVTSHNSAVPSPKSNAEFGGLPVRYDEPSGPYVVCPSEGGPSEALAAGCRFDLLANGWVPAPCFDEERHAYFVDQRDYYFWLDKEKRHRVHQDQILEGTMEYPAVYVSFEEHYQHCRYLLNGTQRYALDPSLGVMETHMDTEHMNHCIDFLAESRAPLTLEVGVRAFFGYKKCFLPRSKTL